MTWKLCAIVELEVMAQSAPPSATSDRISPAPMTFRLRQNQRLFYDQRKLVPARA
jgi:hypothetical protein